MKVMSVKTGVLLAGIFVFSPLAQTTFYPVLEEALTNGSTTAKQEGGTFTPEGWNAVGTTDRLVYTLPKGSVSGSMEFEVKGWSDTKGKELHVWSVCNVYATRYQTKEPCNQHDCIHFRLNDNHDDPVKEMLRAHGHIISGAYPGNTSCSKFVGLRPKKLNEMGFQAGDWYKIRFQWTPKNAQMFKNGKPELSITWSERKVSPPREVINLGNDPYYGYNGAKNTVYKNVKITADVPPAAFIQKKRGKKATLNIGPNPFARQLQVFFAGAQGAAVRLTDVRGKRIAQKKVQQNGSAVFKTRDLGRGVYLIHLFGPSGRALKKQLIFKI